MVCKICNLEFNGFVHLGVHIKKKHNITTKYYYDTYIKKESEGICKICGKYTKFNGLKVAYKSHCSSKCISNDPEQKNKIVNNIDYKLALEKRKQTCLTKYGVEFISQLEPIKNQIKQTCLTKYGVIAPVLLPENVEKLKNSQIINAKEIDINRKNTWLKKYGVDHISKLLKIKEKKIETSLNRYGVEYPLQSEEIKTNIKQTCLKKYGVDNPSKSLKIVEKIKKNQLECFYNRLPIKFPNYIPMFKLEDYVGCHKEYQWKCSKCQTTFFGKFTNNYTLNCPNCEPNNKSTFESELYWILSKYDKNILQNKRNLLIGKLELDLYFPDKNIAIELNGNYWHSELTGGKSYNYHINKTKLCDNKNITLLQIFEDEWILKNKIVKNRLKSIFGFIKYKIFARKCYIKEVDTKLKNKFLNKYHIQGEDSSTKNLGLFYKNRLISLMTFKILKNNTKKYELSRFCSINNFNVVGGASKLLTYFERNYKPEKIITYADRRWSKGDLYYKLGFELDHINKPTYWYTQNYKQRIHKFNFRRKQLQKILKIFDLNLSEWENMKANSYDRIWDCGNYVFTKSYSY